MEVALREWLTNILGLHVGIQLVVVGFNPEVGKVLVLQAVWGSEVSWRQMEFVGLQEQNY